VLEVEDVGSLNQAIESQRIREVMLVAEALHEQRIAEIARALVLTPRFVLLDEPFAGIDPLAVADIQRIIGQLKSRNIGILITDHNVRETLNITDRAYIINEGKILRGGRPQELTADEEVRKVYLGENFRLN